MDDISSPHGDRVFYKLTFLRILGGGGDGTWERREMGMAEIRMCLKLKKIDLIIGL